MKCKITLYYIIAVSCIVQTSAVAQTAIKKKKIEPKRGLTDLPQLIFTDIPGAPKLTAPSLITGSQKPVISQGFGWAAPAFYDWDGDGLKDLLIGEFGSGLENGKYVGNFVRVFTNSGTETTPEFTGLFGYANKREPRILTNGTPFSVEQFCCIGFTPQFIDLNSDGYPDMVTGNYFGEVTWFRGTENGFLPGEPLNQEGDTRSLGWEKKENFLYWTYSPASFGDLSGDDLPDLILGGSSLRISKNIGTKTDPKFAKRELILDTLGNPLKVYTYKQDELKEHEEREKMSRGMEPVPVAGDHHVLQYVVDWDNDGILDLLATNTYSQKGLNVVDFFKGVKLNGEHRFQQAIPLFTAKTGAKAFPGCQPIVTVTDWNNDGINDLLIGISIVMMNGQFNDQLSWNWEKDQNLHGPGKDPIIFNSLSQKELKDNQRLYKLPTGISMKDYMTIHHRGYVYVMLGKKS